MARMKTSSSHRISRRHFLGTAAKTAALLSFPTILPARVLGLEGATPPSEKIAVGLIGCGNIARGQAHYGDADSVVAAVCDVRPERRADFKTKYGNCTDYIDFRELLANKSIDAVHVSTPDHWHVPMAVMAAEAGKHMNIEKPFSMSVGGLLAVDRALAERKVVFQFGTENRCDPRAYRFVELAANGFLGPVIAAVVWGPDGGMRPGPDPTLSEPVPEGLDWDLWLGPAPQVPFHSRRLVYTGSGDYTLGRLSNWGIHMLNIFQWWADVAGHGVPVVFRGAVKMNPHPQFNNAASWDMELEYTSGFKLQFLSDDVAAKKNLPTYHLTPRKVGAPNGVTLIGEKGWLHWGYPAIFESSLMPYAELMRYKLPEQRVAVPKSAGGLNPDFIRAIKTGATPIANWPSTFRSDMIPVLVDLAGRTQSEVRWDPAAKQVTAPASAQPFLRRAMRDPWGKTVYKYLEPRKA